MKFSEDATLVVEFLFAAERLESLHYIQRLSKKIDRLSNLLINEAKKIKFAEELDFSTDINEAVKSVEASKKIRELKKEVVGYEKALEAFVEEIIEVEHLKK